MKKSADVLPFRPLGDSTNPPGENWLKAMENGQRFLATRRGEDGPMLYDFTVASDPKVMEAVYMFQNSGRGGEFFFIDPNKFVNRYDLYLKLEVIHGDNNQVHSGPVERDAQPEERSGVHEGQ